MDLFSFYFYTIIPCQQLFNKITMSLARRFFGQMDMFAAPPTLRAKQQDKSSSLFTGVISFLLVLTFTYVFISSAIGVITYQKIDSVQTQSKLGFEEAEADSIFFAIRVGYLTLEDSRKYFDLGFFVNGEDGSNLTYSLQQCSPQQWKKLGDKYLQEFNKFELSQFLCNKPEDSVKLKKVYYAPNSQFAVIYIRPCGTLNPTCQTLENQREFIYQLNSIEGAIFVQLYLLDQSISPGDKEPTNYVTNSDPQFSFTTKRGIVATVQFGSYEIQTDTSIFPVQDIEIKKGNFLNSFRQTGTQINYPDDNFALIYLAMNRRHILLERKVGKLDEMLSYAGGLFSIILGFLAIFLTSYNKYRYELMVAEGIFHEDQDGNAIKQNQFSFLLYIKYSIFDWISTFFCRQPKWQDCLIVDSTREEAKKQMDVTRLFRKIQSLQISVSHLIKSQGLKDCLNLIKPVSLSEIIRNRLVLQYYSKIIKGKSSMTFSQYKICRTLLKLGLNLAKDQEDQAVKKQNEASVSNCMIAEQLDNQELQIDYGSLQNQSYLMKTVEENFQEEVRESGEAVLDESERQVQLCLAEQFFKLTSNEKQKILENIPIKILYRLAKVWTAFKSQKDSSSNYGSRLETKNSKPINKCRKLPPLQLQFALHQKIGQT